MVWFPSTISIHLKLVVIHLNASVYCGFWGYLQPNWDTWCRCKIEWDIQGLWFCQVYKCFIIWLTLSHPDLSFTFHTLTSHPGRLSPINVITRALFAIDFKLRLNQWKALRGDWRVGEKIIQNIYFYALSPLEGLFLTGAVSLSLL